MAIAVVVEEQNSTGGATAAPVAKDVLQALLGSAVNSYPVVRMASGDHLIDTLFDGRYLIVRQLGSGGMANVYLAEDQELGRHVAIKILDDRHARDEQFVERFRREAQNAAGLSHPNIVSIYDRGDSEGTYYIAMEHIEGRDAEGAARRARARRRSGSRSTTRARSSRRSASRTATGSCTATSSRTT